MKIIGTILILAALILAGLGFRAKNESEWWSGMVDSVSDEYKSKTSMHADKNSTKMAIYFGMAGVMFISGVIVLASGSKTEGNNK